MTDRDNQLHELVQQLPEPIILFKTDGRIVDANLAAVRALGKTREALRDLTIGDLYLGDLPAFRRYLALCAASRELIPGRIRLRAREGEVEYKCDAASLEPDTIGQAPGYLFLRFVPHGDATKRFQLLSNRIEQLGQQVELRMRAEQLVESQRDILQMIVTEEPLEKILESVVHFIDSQSRSGALASILLYDGKTNTLRHGAAPSLPEFYSEAVDGIGVGPDVGSCGAAAHHREPVCAEDVTTDPNWRDFKDLALKAGLRSCFSTPITGRSNELLGTFALYYPTPRQPDPEDQRILSLLSRTAGLAIERGQFAAEIRNLLEREREARNEAEEANRSKDEFLAMVSHELRNPLNAILGWAKVLTMDNLDADSLSTGIEAIERNATLQAQLIEEILDYSRIRAGKLKLDIESIDLHRLVLATVTSTQPAADARQITLQTSLVELEGVTIALDAGRIQQVLTNLLGNALKFTPRGGRIKIDAHKDDAQVIIGVEDTGCGIDAKFLPHVFERFRQQDRSGQKEHEGLGLGLAIVKHIVELHHGQISASSEGRNRGARFEVTLPRKFAWRHRKTLDKDSGTPNFEGLKVLAVDDAPDTRSLLQTLFTRARADVTVAANGEEALELLSEKNFELLLCDIGMPGLDGYQVVRRLRAKEAAAAEGSQRITAIALTAYARAVDRQRALDAGFDAHMAKPIDPAQLMAVVAQNMRDHG